MRATLEQYRDPINRGEINPHLRYDGRRSGTLLDPSDPRVPLHVLSFAVYQLTDGPWEWETGPRENVLVLQRGSCTVTVDGTAWQVERRDGPFAPEGGPSPSNAVYVPRDARCTVAGDGELAVFAAPASERRPAACIASTDHPWVNRGTAFWRRDVTTLVVAGQTSCNLTVGETYSPPGLWSGMPLHRHDLDDPRGGQSDHEEVYYFQFRETAPPLAAFGVQLLFDDQGLNQSYRVGPRSVIALPGACHPVVAGPGCDLLYVWGLASPAESPLRMWDVPDTAFLARVGALIDQARSGSDGPLTRERVAEMANSAGLDAHGQVILCMMLEELRLLPRQ